MIKIFFPIFADFTINKGNMSIDINKYKAVKSVYLQIYKTEIYKHYTHRNLVLRVPNLVQMNKYESLKE